MSEPDGRWKQPDHRSSLGTNQWHLMVEEMRRVLKPGGSFFARLASITGKGRESPAAQGSALSSADGSDRFLVDEEMLVATANYLRGDSLDPLKTVIVHNMRSMTRWCLRKK